MSNGLLVTGVLLFSGMAWGDVVNITVHGTDHDYCQTVNSTDSCDVLIGQFSYDNSGPANLFDVFNFAGFGAAE